MSRFSNGTQARMVVTDLNTETTTLLDKALLQGTIAANLNQPWVITGAVRSGDPAVNGIFSADADPLVAQSNRLVYVFLREQGITPWVCRASGIIMSPQDEADSDTGTTNFTAYDPWQYLQGRPCMFEDGTLPGPSGGPGEMLFTTTIGSHIVAELLFWLISNDGGAFIDAGPTYGGTVFWTGTIEDTPVITFQVEQGTSVGDAWNNLVATGDPSGGDGGIDIVLTPIYDPVNRPGYLAELSVFNLAGSPRPAAPMAWGSFARTSTTADREHDGTPGNFINKAQYYAGQGGPAVGPGFGPVVNAASVAKYTPYWAQQFFPDQPQATSVLAMAYQALNLAKQGKRTFTVNPDPMRAAMPFRDYMPGDFLPVIASNQLRVPASGQQRVEGIPVQINPDGVTRVNALLTTPDWRGDGN